MTERRLLIARILYPGLIVAVAVISILQSTLEEFGQARLAQVVVENRDLTAQELIDGINEEVTAFIGGEPQFDDFTLVVLKCL